MFKFIILISALAVICQAGLVPAAVPAALTVGTYATSYNAHAVNHAIAAPFVAAPAVAAAPYVAAPAVAAAPFAPYAAHPALSAYSAPLIYGR